MRSHTPYTKSMGHWRLSQVGSEDDLIDAGYCRTWLRKSEAFRHSKHSLPQAG